MKTELTLSIEQDVVEAAETLATQQGVSLSDVVEAHLKQFTNKSGQPSLARQLFGSAEGRLSTKSDKEIWEEMQEERMNQ